MTEPRRVLIVFGSGTRLLDPLIEEYRVEGTVLRLFRSIRPNPAEGCIDIGSISELEPLLKRLEVTYGCLKIDLVGAASEYQNSLFYSLDEPSIQRLAKTGVLDYLELLGVLLKFMVRSRYGRLIFLSSFRAVHQGKGVSLYSATKSFNESLFASLGVEYGRLGLSACSIRMGYFDGRMLENMLAQDAQVPQSLKSANVGSAEELCSAIRFAISNKMTNGGVLELYGGLAFE